MVSRLVQTDPAEMNKRKGNPRTSMNHFTVSLITAIIGGLALIGAALLNGYWNREVEKQRLQRELILKAVEAGDKETALKNLEFFLKAGFIDDPDGKIGKLLQEGKVPILQRGTVDVTDFLERGRIPIPTK